ncbi:MAG: hypothetical protein ACOC0Z_01740 [Halohasta sp.]
MDGSLTAAVGATTPLPWPVILSIGAVAGLLASIVMNWPMSRQTDGFTPAAIAAAVVSRQPVAEVSMPQLLVVHHATGMLAGVGYGLFVAIGSWIGLPSPLWLDGMDIVVHLLSVTAIVVFIYSFFAHVVLPRAGGRSYEEQATAIRGQWLRSSLVYGVALAVLVPAIVLSLP